MAHAHLQEVTTCPSCKASLAGPFCHECGEARPDPHDFSWKHTIHDAFHEFAHLDGKILQTLWLLIRRPGLLTAEYWEGRRRLHIRPLRLYIVIAAIHLIAMSASFYRVDFFLRSDSGGALNRMISKIAARDGTTVEHAKAAVNEKLAKAYSVTQYFAVLAFAVFPWAIFRRRRPHYLQHVIFSIHVYGFYFLVTAAVSQVLSPETWRRSPLPLVTVAYLYFAIRRLYGDRPLTALWKAAVLRLALFAAEFAAIGVAMAAAFALVNAH
jgi:hypothetical protein